MPPPGMTAYTYALDENGFILNNDSNGVPFFDVTEVKGLDTSPIRLNTNERMGIDGTWVDARYSSMRTIVITGQLYTNPTDPDTLLDQIRAAYSDPTIRRFYFQHPGKPLRFLWAQGGGLSHAADTNRRLGITTIQLTLLCQDPHIYDYTPSVSSVTLIANQGATQLNTNGTFAGGTVSPWVGGNGAALAASSTQVYGTNAFSMAMTPNGTTANPQAQAEKDAITAPNSFTATGLIFSTTTWASGIQMGINWYNASNTFIASNFSAGGVSLPANTWTPITVTATAPTTAAGFSSNATQGAMVGQVQGTPPNTQVFYFANMFFYEDAGLGFPTGFNVSFGVGPPPNQVAVTNLGTKVAYPFFTITGPASNPQIVDQLGNIVMSFGIVLGPTDVLTIDCNLKQIVLNGVSNQRSTYMGMKWPSVPAGATASYLFSVSGVPGATLTAQLYNTYH